MSNQSTPGTLIHGCAATEHLDSSGERLIIRGIDISSLERGEGTLNYEHKNDTPSQTVGKIIKAKKIFSEADCEDAHQKYFWDKCQAPFLYIVGELLDGVGHQQAQEIAAMLRYDAQKRKEGAETKNMINFSIEGSKLEKKNNEITHSIARKVTLTIAPCNKKAVAEQLDRPEPQKETTPTKERFFKGSSIFKSEEQEQVLIMERASKTEAFKPLKKTLQGAPSTLSQTNALSKELLIKEMKKVGGEALDSFSGAEHLINMIKEKFGLKGPHAKALAKLLFYRKVKKSEEILASLMQDKKED